MLYSSAPFLKTFRRLGSSDACRIAVIVSFVTTSTFAAARKASFRCGATPFVPTPAAPQTSTTSSPRARPYQKGEDAIFSRLGAMEYTSHCTRLGPATNGDLRAIPTSTAYFHASTSGYETLPRAYGGGDRECLSPASAYLHNAQVVRLLVDTCCQPLGMRRSAGWSNGALEIESAHPYELVRNVATGQH